MRDTLSIADSVIAYSSGKVTLERVESVLGSTDEKMMIEFYNRLYDKDAGGLLELINKVDSEGKNMAILVKDLSKHARNLLVCRSCIKPNDILNMSEESFAMIKAQAENFDEKTLISYMQAFGGAENELRYTSSPRLLLETLALSVMSGMDGEEVKKN